MRGGEPVFFKPEGFAWQHGNMIVKHCDYLFNMNEKRVFKMQILTEISATSSS